MVAYADVVTQREVLAGLLAEPRMATGIISTGGTAARPYGFKTRARRGRIISAGSPYHAVRSPTGTFLGVVKVAPADRPGVPAVAERLAALVEAGPLARVAGGARRTRRSTGTACSRWRRSTGERGEPAPPREQLDAIALSPEDAAELERRRAMAPDDVTALLLVGLIRSGVHVGASHLRSLFWARPLSPAALDRAAAKILEHDEDRELLNSAVKGSDGFFTTFFVSTYSKYIARWAAHRGLTPNQVTMISVAVGVLAAAAFATGERPGMVAGAVLLYFAFVLDCVDGQLARYTRQFSKLGAWLDSIFDRTKEYVVFAGLAIGASRTGDPVWLLAGAALTLQTARHAVDFSYPASQHQVIAAAPQPPIEDPFDGPRPASRLTQPVDAEEAESLPDAAAAATAGRDDAAAAAGAAVAGDRPHPELRWVKKIIAFPIGERFAVISITAALFSRAHGVHRPAGVGRLRGRLRPRRPDAAVARWHERRDRPQGRRRHGAGERARVLPRRRADRRGDRRRGRRPARACRRSRCCSSPALPGLVAIVRRGRRRLARRWSPARSPGPCSSAGSRAAARSIDRLRWVVPSALRVIEYGGAAVDRRRRRRLVAARRLRAAVRDHLPPLRRRLRATATAASAAALGRRPPAAAGTGGCCSAWCCCVAGALPAGFYVLAGAIAALFVGVTIAQWRHIGRAEQPVYDDEEDEDD